MKALTGTRLLAIALLAVGTTLTACSDGGASGDGGGSTAPAAEAGKDASGAAVAGGRDVAAYTDCMAGHGIRVVDGKTRTDGVDDTALGKAVHACRSSAPADVRIPVTRWEQALLTDFVGCMREKGHQGYGDPDPRTGTYTAPKDSEIDKDAEIACLGAAEQKAGQ